MSKERKFVSLPAYLKKHWLELKTVRVKYFDSNQTFTTSYTVVDLNSRKPNITWNIKTDTGIQYLKTHNLPAYFEVKRFCKVCGGEVPLPIYNRSYNDNTIPHFEKHHPEVIAAWTFRYKLQEDQ